MNDDGNDERSSKAIIRRTYIIGSVVYNISSKLLELLDNNNMTHSTV